MWVDASHLHRVIRFEQVNETTSSIGIKIDYSDWSPCWNWDYTTLHGEIPMQFTTTVFVPGGSSTYTFSFTIDEAWAGATVSDSFFETGY